MYSLLKKFVSSKEKHQENIYPIFDLIRKYSLEYYDDGKGVIIPESIDNFINNLYTLISISKSEKEDFNSIQTLFNIRIVMSEKKLTLEGYKAYISKNANKQSNLDKLIDFIIEKIINDKWPNNSDYITVIGKHLDDIENIKDPALNINRNKLINKLQQIEQEEKEQKRAEREQRTMQILKYSLRPDHDGNLNLDDFNGNGGNNKQYKEILGKRRRIYKIKGSRKEHVKYKGELIPVSDYKKLFKK